MPHAWVEVDLGVVRSNLRAVRSILKPWVDVIAMVKGNAYGHGGVEVARALIASGASRLGVAFVSEAVELREHGISCPILLAASFSRSDVDDVLGYDLTPAIWDLDLAKELSQRARRRGRRAIVHVDVDTGMGRLGVRFDKAPWFVDNIRALDGLSIEGLFTHLSSADEKDQSFSRLQIRRFLTVIERLKDRGVTVPYTHVQNSAGILNLPDVSFQAVRPGLSLYGLYPSSECSRRVPLKPALSFYSRVVMVKRVPPDTFVSYNRTHRTASERNLATVSSGYADGVPRELSSKGRVLIRGRSYPIVGRVTMDHIIVDLDQDEVRVGDRVTLIGQDGTEIITADEIAGIVGTINYDITTGISHRVRRTYQGVESRPYPMTLVPRVGVAGA